MAENVLKLKKRAVSLGMSKDEAREAGRKVLEAFIADAENGGGEKKAAKKAVKKAVAKKKVAGKKSSENKKASTKKAPAEKSGKGSGKAKRPRAKSNDGIGRASIGEIDWKVESDEWNPRKGSPVEGLFRALKKAKGNIDKAFDAIHDDMYEYVGRKKRDGTKRTKAEAEAMLRYRLNRTKYEYATRTGQHEQATERAEYGTGQYATTRAKNKRTRDKNSKSSRKQNRTTSKSKSSGTKKSTKRKSGKK